MSEAPKKIWMVEETCWLNHDQPSGDIPYIRADLVDDLVEALEDLTNRTSEICEWSYGDEMDEAFDKARAALARVKDE